MFSATEDVVLKWEDATKKKDSPEDRKEAKTVEGGQISQVNETSQKSFGETMHTIYTEYCQDFQKLFEALNSIQIEIAQVKAKFHTEVHDII